MNDLMKTKEQLIDELKILRKRLAEGEASKDKQEFQDNRPLRREDIFRCFVENANDIIFSLTPDGILTYISPNCQEIMGYDIHKVVGQPLEAFVHTEDIPLCRAFMERVVATGKKQGDIEYRVHDKSGAWRWHATNASPVRNDDGNIISYMGIARDITDRKLVEEALLESEKQYRLVVENAREAISIAQDGMHKFVNRRALEILGYSKEELTSRPFIEFVHPDDREMVLERYRKRMKNKNALSVYPLKIIAKDGTVKWIEIYPSLISWNGKPATLNFFIDITDRIRAEEALRASELRYRTIFENTGTTMLIVEEDMTISLANHEYDSLTGYKREEIEGKRKWTEFVEKGDLEKMINQHRLRRVDSHLAMNRYEFRLVHRDGNLKNILLTVDIMPGMKRSVASLLDITEHKRMEERLNRAEKMESMGRLAGGVAHDLNNVLGVLVGYSELLLKNLPEDNPLRRYADNILQSSMRGAAIIQDLLTLARRSVTVSEVVDINNVIFDYLKTLEFEKLRSYHPNVKVCTRLEDGILNIKGSPVHLGKTLMNLVSNAAEAISDHGEVTIRTEKRYLDQHIRGYDDVQEGDYVVLTVSDSGMGIPYQDIDKIFEPFYTKKVMGRSGTGLGLAVVWGTVKDHNGYINVQSKEGEGTTFELLFPITREDITKAKEASSPSIYMGRGESILVVDDRKEQRELAMNMLGWLGYQVDALSSGEGAIEYLKNKKMDLVILDMIMDPGIDGLETYRRILEINPKQKAIIVSGFSETDRVKKAIAIGSGAFVRKPYILEKIGLAVREELDRLK
jgi:two-component system, cell cycle sensor histidine kinase and response regulator CckA